MSALISTRWWPYKLYVFLDSRCIVKNTVKLIFCWDAQKRQQTYTSTSCCSRKLVVFSFITSFLFPVSLAGAPSLHAWWLDPRLKIPIINLHHDKLRKCCVSLPLPYFPLSLCLPLSPASSFIPHKHMRYGAVLMRTEWTDPRPQRHWGPPPQIHHRYQFSSVLFKRPQCGIPDTLALCSMIPSQIPHKPPLCPFLWVYCRNADVLPFLSLHVHCRNSSNVFLLKNLQWNRWQSHALFGDCIMDHNTDIPFDVPPSALSLIHPLDCDS